MKKQNKSDKYHEKKGMKKRKMAAAGRAYNRSEKHRAAESSGMKMDMGRGSSKKGK